MMNGIDISIYQGDVDFGQVKASGIAFCYAKAAEGTSYADANFAGYHDQAKTAGLPFGPYFFFHGAQDGAAQAQAFLAAIDGREGDLLPMVDCEAGGLDGVSAGAYLGELAKFLEIVDATLEGKRTIIYFGYSFWHDTLGGYDGFSGHPAWVAAYNSDTTLDMTGTGWTKWTIWQFSDGSGQTPIPGISGNVDRDRLNGDDLSIIRR